MKRKAKIARKTKETNILVDLNIDGKGKYNIKTGIGFLDHMLEQLSKHSLIDIVGISNQCFFYLFLTVVGTCSLWFGFTFIFYFLMLSWRVYKFMQP